MVEYAALLRKGVSNRGLRVTLYILYVIAAVAILWKTADWFVEGAVGIAQRLGVPEMLVGIVLVSLATTSPELMASLLAALQGMPEVALGNAVGSVIVDDTVALGLAALVSASPLIANPRIFRTSALVVIISMFICFGLAFDGTLSRWEGAVLVGVFALYSAFSYWDERRRRMQPAALGESVNEELLELENTVKQMGVGKILILFIGGFLGVLLGSELLLRGAKGIAELMGLSPVVIGLTVVAIGTSVPEIATCVTSARKGKGGIGIGNIIGADILNICWVAGMSAVANPLVVQKSVINLMFPMMVVIVLSMLGMLRYKHRLTRLNGAILVAMYAVYIAVLLIYAPPGEIPAGH